MHRLLLVTLLCFACRNTIDTDKVDTVDTIDTVDTDTVDPPTDADGDGYPSSEDCDDGNASVFPGAEERCNGIDDDCNNVVDDNATDFGTWYIDIDEDGYGDENASYTGCTPIEGSVDNSDDCDPVDPEVFPGADERCNDIDDDCDNDIDEDAIDATPFFVDGDGDGYGDPNLTFFACEGPDAGIVDDTDCDDGDATVFPGADELCNAVDDDCDNDIDEDAVDVSIWYADADGDGFGDALLPVQACDPPLGTVADATDCDDTQDDTFPGAVERCNGIDDDCDTRVDADAVDATAWYDDTDGDAFGDGPPILACAAPPGTVDTDGDCDDLIASVYPGAPELCDTLDNDCNGTADDSGADGTWYRDADGDGVGTDADVQTACAAPAGYVAASGDCDDTDDATRPGADEDCDPIDRDCDGDPTAGAVDALTWWLDADRDGVGGDLASQQACTAPTGFVDSSDDCDDLAPQTNPGADELCDGADNDCDTQIDEDPVNPGSWFLDEDGDGFGDDATVLVACIRPPDRIARGGDCDDTTSAARPGGTELCDGVDNDCNDAVDDAAVDAGMFFADDDGDTYGDPLDSVEACAAPDDYVGRAGDCNDDEALAWTGAPELCDSVDNDCDGTTDVGALDAGTWFTDSDGDTFGDPATAVIACTAPPNTVATAGDCDDTEPLAWSDAPELCDSVDNDCDGTTDVGALDAETWYPDLDGDSRGDTLAAVRACTAPANHIALPGDCNDSDPLAWTGALERCDGSDNDCDGTTDVGAFDATLYFLDDDGDDYGRTDAPLDACALPAGYAAVDGDCEDGDPDVNPGAAEVCNGLDDDCDGDADDGRLGYGPTCAAVSCAEVLTSDPTAASGLYWLDPRGTGATEWSCDMVTDGGGWTQIGAWDRENDGDTILDLETAYPQLFNNMGILEEEPDFFRWYDGNESSDALAYGLEVVIPNDGEVLLDLKFTGASMEHSGVWWFVEDAAGTRTDIVCQEDDPFTCSNGSACDYDAVELSYYPYQCSLRGGGNWNNSFIDVYQTAGPMELTSFNFWTLMDASTGDDARLYWMDVWVR